jgi:hypothetical protein
MRGWRRGFIFGLDVSLKEFPDLPPGQSLLFSKVRKSLLAVVLKLVSTIHSLTHWVLEKNSVYRCVRMSSSIFSPTDFISLYFGYHIVFVFSPVLVSK